MTDDVKSGCPVCGNNEITYHGYGETLVGYFSPPGHNHDDNCKIHSYSCANKHQWSARRRNTCPACDWQGKLECFCHPLGVRIYEQRGKTSDNAKRLVASKERKGKSKSQDQA